MKIDWRTQNDDELRDELEGDAVAQINEEPSMTVQSFAQEVDINNIIRLYGIKDGALPPADVSQWLTGDISEYHGLDLADIMNRTRAAEEAFNNLPAPLRSRFDNSVNKLWKWVTDPANRKEAIELGFLLKQPQDEAPKETPTE